MNGKNRNKARLQHILDAIFEIEDYVQSVDFTEFTKNRMMQSACIRQLEIIGEAANYISDEA